MMPVTLQNCQLAYKSKLIDSKEALAGWHPSQVGLAIEISTYDDVTMT